MTEGSDFTRTIGEILTEHKISRRTFLKFCMATASMSAMTPSFGQQMADRLWNQKRPSVIYLSFQECTGCLESFTRSESPSVENLLFNIISLDYDDTLMAAAGTAAEEARETAMEANKGKYVLIVDGAIPRGAGGAYCTQGGRSAIDILEEVGADAGAVMAIGTCASFGGLPHAAPNPTGAVAASDILTDRPVMNVSGCPPIPSVITGTIVHYLTLGSLPELDKHGRPLAFFGNSIHDRCYRRPYYDEGKFAKTFDDEGARNGWCLYELGCKGPTTYNACATVKWNDGTSFPIESGHPCLGCSEPGFWDHGGFYEAQSAAVLGDKATLGAAAAAGVALGAGAAGVSRWRQKKRIKAGEEEDSS